MMALSDFVAELDQLAAQAQEAFDAASSQETLEAARIEFLGAKKGRLKALLFKTILAIFGRKSINS